MNTKKKTMDKTEQTMAKEVADKFYNNPDHHSTAENTYSMRSIKTSSPNAINKSYKHHKFRSF